MSQYTYGSQETTSGRLFSNMNPGAQTEIVRLNDARLYPQTQLTSPISTTLDSFYETSIKVPPFACILDNNVYFLWSIMFNTH